MAQLDPDLTCMFCGGRGEREHPLACPHDAAIQNPHRCTQCGGTGKVHSSLCLPAEAGIVCGNCGRIHAKPKARTKPERKLMHWYLTGPAKTACGLPLSRRHWTWTDRSDVTCTKCLAALKVVR
jgi:hypothetical protein